MRVSFLFLNLSAHALPDDANQRLFTCHISFSSHEAVNYNARHSLLIILTPHPPLLLPRLLRITANNLDLLRRHSILIIQLEVDIFNQECPNFVAEAVGVKMALHRSAMAPLPGTSLRSWYLEIHARLDFVGQDFCDGLIEGGDDFHGGLGLNAARVDEVVERVDEGHADAVENWVLVGTGFRTGGGGSPATTIELVVGPASRGHVCG